MTTPAYGGLDDLAYLGAEAQPSTGELTDPRAHVGRPAPLDVKLQAFYQGQSAKFTMLAVSVAPVGIPDSPDGLSATVQVQGNPVRWTFDGSPPSAVNGFRADAGAIITLTGRESIKQVLFVREGAADATLAIQQWF